MTTYHLECTVNGEPYSGEVHTGRMLSDFLRDDLYLTGTKRGCETGVCGACSILLDGEVVKSCLMFAFQANGHSITTIEGLAKGDELHPLQKSFMECGGLQCGYCTPGMIMASCDLLKNNPNPTVEEVQQGLSGNLCRCTGYTQIVESILHAAREMNHGN